MRPVINHHFGWSKDLLTLPVTPMQHLKDCVIGLGWIVALGNRLVLVRVERLAETLLGLDAVLAEQ